MLRPQNLLATVSKTWAIFLFVMAAGLFVPSAAKAAGADGEPPDDLTAAFDLYYEVGGDFDFYEGLIDGRLTIDDLDLLYWSSGRDKYSFPNGELFVNYAMQARSEKGKPLTPEEIKRLETLVEKANDPKKQLTKQEMEELRRLGERYLDNWPASPSEEQLEFLTKLIKGIAKIVGKVPGAGKPVKEVLKIYAKILQIIKDIVSKGMKENEYKRFKEQMQGPNGPLEGPQAEERFKEIEGAFRPEWVRMYYIRYLIEILLAK